MSKSGNKWWHKALLSNQLGLALDNAADTADLGVYWAHGSDLTYGASGIFRDNSAVGKPFVFFESVLTNPISAPIQVNAKSLLDVGSLLSSASAANNSSPVAMCVADTNEITSPHTGQLAVVAATGILWRYTGIAWDQLAVSNSNAVSSKSSNIVITASQPDAEFSGESCKAVKYRSGTGSWFVVATFDAHITALPASPTTITFTILDSTFFPSETVTFPLYFLGTADAKSIKIASLSTAGVMTTDSLASGAVSGLAIYEITPA